MYCENEVLKFLPQHMHFNSEMLLWSTACLWCIINIFPLFGSSRNHRLCMQTNGQKNTAVQRSVPRVSYLPLCTLGKVWIYCRLSATLEEAPATGASSPWVAWLKKRQHGLEWADCTGSGCVCTVKFRSDCKLPPLGSRASAANQCHDLRGMSLSSHQLACTN